MEKKRMDEWDFIKGVLIVFVIWGHICAYLSGADYEKNLLTTYIRLFQMPLFILVSGYFQKPVFSLSELFKRYKSSLLKIGVPYAVWTAISYMFMLCTKSIVGVFEFSVLEVIRNFSFLWFLGCILLCQFTFSTLSYLLHKIKLIGIALLVCSLIIFLIVSGGYLNVFHFPFLWSFYIAGFFLKYIDIKSGLQKWSVRLSVIFCSMLVLVAGYRFKTEWTFYNSLNCISGKEIEYLGFVIARYILYFAATLSALCFLLLLYDKIGSKFNNIVGYGRKTLFFYVVHVTVLFYTLRLIVSAITEEKGILVNHPVIRYYVIATLITAFVIAIMDKLYTIIEQWKYGSKILLGK